MVPQRLKPLTILKTCGTAEAVPFQNKFKLNRYESQNPCTDGAAFDVFGASAAISGSTIVAGAPKSTTPGEAYVRFLPPIYPQDASSREDLMERVRAAMEEELERRRSTEK